MLRAPYDSDVITWSPQGRLFQVEYATEAVKQGSLVVGLRNKDVGFLIGFKSRKSNLASYQEKLFRVDSHVGCAVCGLTADGRIMLKHMRQLSLNTTYMYEEPVRMEKLMIEVDRKYRKGTMRGGRRPYGVSLLILGCDRQPGSDVRLFEAAPAAVSSEYVAAVCGDRSQGAKTYFEQNYKSFDAASERELLLHGLTALGKCVIHRNATTGAVVNQLDLENISVGVVRKSTGLFEVIDNSQIKDAIDECNRTIISALPAIVPLASSSADHSGDAPMTDTTAHM